MSHHPVVPTSLWSTFLLLDRRIADEVRDHGCRHCPGRLHVANYPRKPRGVARSELGEGYTKRYSFCCADCRRRTTPPTLRFLGRKVYLGALLVLFGNAAADVEPSAAMFRTVAKQSGIPALTLRRWRQWWTRTIPMTRWWRSLRSRLVPTPDTGRLPLALLERVAGVDEPERLTTVLALTGPLSTCTCSHFPRVGAGTHKML